MGYQAAACDRVRCKSVARAVAVRTTAAATWAERASDWLRSRPYALYLFLVPLLPLVFLGYGTDVDTWNVRNSANSIRAGDYVMSRPPAHRCTRLRLRCSIRSR